MIRSRIVTALSVLLLMAACDGAGTAPVAVGVPGFLAQGGPTDSAAQAQQAPLRQATLAAGGITVIPPEGYCIDPSTLRNGRRDGFAMLASCRLLSGEEGGDVVVPVIVTVSVGPRGGPDDLPSPAGLAALTVASLQGRVMDEGLVMAHLAGGGDALLTGADPRHWRAAFLLRGRVMGLALYAPVDSNMAGAQGRMMLSRVHDALRAANPDDTQVAGGGAPMLQRLFGR